MKKAVAVFVFCIFLSGMYSAHVFGSSESSSEIPVKNMVTLLDLGAKKCVPCKMMEPILSSLKKEYKGRASIVFVDVWEKPDAAMKYGIRTIPTQIFFDKDGNEVSRHVGFMDKKSIVGILKQLGVN